eukprot:CAMPEP_0194061028 /NCGR_PEP_ID=MMETSP0009_2-20130614/73472_1 /TAXON_ID=210454 /ORGANISM="Grammatophora oceanica, Strain CCMP 410" /LENGTH=117 /DNA_ID=CAMNT_0038712181 /DNA_START=8 /DNA_END=357 /DNA_ORIENTATION=-
MSVGSKPSRPPTVPSQKAESMNRGEEVLSNAYREICEAKGFIGELSTRLQQLTAEKATDSERIESLESQLEVVKNSNKALMLSARSAGGEIESLRTKLEACQQKANLDEELEDEKRR